MSDRLTNAVRRIRDEADPDAFADLIRRHGPMVWGVCRRMLPVHQDAEDAWQATFLSLAIHRDSVREPAALSSWLYRTAFRCAAKLAREHSRRRRRERAASVGESGREPDHAERNEINSLIDQEIAALPEIYRSPLVLCGLQEKSKQQAARELGWKEGTLSGRLARAKELLRRRLDRRGLALPVLGGLCAEPPRALAAATARLAKVVTLCDPASAEIPRRIAELAAVGGKTAGAWLSAGVAVVMVALTAGAVAFSGSPHLPAVSEADKPVAPADRPPPVGEAGMIARFGEPRFKHGPGRIQRLFYTSDGKRIVTSGSDGDRIWDAETGLEIPLPEGIEKPRLAATPDGLKLIRHVDGRLNLLELDASAPPDPGEPKGQGLVHGIFDFVSPDGRTAVRTWMSIRQNPRGSFFLRFRDLKTGRESDTFPIAGQLAIQGWAFSADGKTLSTRHYRAGGVMLWDVPGRKKIRAGRFGEVQSGVVFAMSPDGTILVTSDKEPGRIHLWDAETFEELPLLPGQPEGDGGTAQGMNFSPDGRSLLAWYNSADLRLWDLPERKLLWKAKVGRGQAFDADFSPDGKTVALANYSSVERLDVKTGKPIEEPPYFKEVSGLAFLPDGETIAVGVSSRAGSATGREVALWDIRTGELRRRLPGQPGGTRALAVDPRGRRLAAEGYRGSLPVWDLKTGRRTVTLEVTPSPRGYAVSLSPAGGTVAVGGFRYGPALFDAETGRTLWKADAHRNVVRRVAFTTGGEVAADAGDFAVELHDTETGTVTRSIVVEKTIRDFAVSGNRLVIVTEGGTAHVFDTRTGAEAARLAIEPSADGVSPHRIIRLALSPDGRNLAVTYLGDEVTHVHEVATGEPRIRLSGHRGYVTALAFSPDGKLLATGSGDHTTAIWNLYGVDPAGDDVSAWESLSSEDGGLAFRAVRQLVGQGGPAIELLREKLNPVERLDTARVKELIGDLSSRSFARREAASKELAGLGFAAAPALRQALDGEPPPEAAQRIRRLLAPLDSDRERRLSVRAVEVAEHIASAGAVTLLRQWAGGRPDATLTEEAKAALGRLDDATP